MRNARRILPLCAALLGVAGLTACASAGGQPSSRTRMSVGDSVERAAAVPPVYALLGEREAIGLTSSQIAALDSLAMWLDSANRPLLNQLVERGIRRDDDPIRREGDPPRVDREGRPLLEEIGANNHAAEAAIQGLLTEDQQAKVCHTFSRTRRERSTSVPRSTARLGVAPGFGSPDVVNYTWPWCVERTGDDAGSQMSSA